MATCSSNARPRGSRRRTRARCASPSARASAGGWRRTDTPSPSRTSTAPSWRTPCSARAASVRSWASPFSSRGGGSGCSTWAPSSRARSAAPTRTDDAYSPARVARTGRPQLVAEVTEAILAEAARDLTHLDLLHQLELTSSITVPLVARGRTLGTLSVAISASGRRYTQEDLIFIEEVAARAALAVDNARLYREAQETSRLKDEFLATLSHELRTPLTSVLAWMWMLRRGRLDQPAAERARETMEKSIRSPLHIIGAP